MFWLEMAQICVIILSKRTAQVCDAELPLFRERKACSPQELDALYLRRPQAERERMARLAQTK